MKMHPPKIEASCLVNMYKYVYINHILLFFVFQSSIGKLVTL